MISIESSGFSVLLVFSSIKCSFPNEKINQDNQRCKNGEADDKSVLDAQMLDDVASNNMTMSILACNIVGIN